MNHHYPPKPTGPGVRFNYDRNVREALIRSRPAASAFTRTSDTTAGVFVNAVPAVRRPGGQSFRLQRFVIDSIAGDYITGTRVPEVAGNVTVFIAKPPLIRRSDWHNVERDGIAYSSVGDDGLERRLSFSSEVIARDDAEANELLTPSYIVGDAIFAYQPDGGTGVSVNGADLEWMDANSTGRVFLPPYALRRVCINGSWKYVVRRESEPFGNA